MAILATYTGTGNTWNVPSSGSFTWSKIGCSFTTTAGGDTGYIELSVKRVGSPGTLTVNLYASDGDNPTGAALATGTYTTDSIGTSALETISVTLSATTLANTTKYVFTLELSVGVAGTDYLVIGARDSFGVVYAGGEGVKYDGSWSYIRTPPVSETALTFEVGTSTGLPSKASNPNPADDATGVDWSTPTISWTGDGDTYNIYIGGGGNFDLVEEGLGATTYTLDASEKAFCICGTSATGVRWRIDSVNAVGTTTGDTWEFDPRPGAPTNPTPADSGTDISIRQAMSWDAGTNATSYDLWVDGSQILTGTEDVSYTLASDLFSWGGVYPWRVDAINYYGTTTGTTWSFTALSLDPVISSYTLIDGGSGEGPLTGGVEGTDFNWTGLNNITTVKRLVVIAKDRLYFEDL